MAGKVRHLLYRQGRYYARLVVPAQLRRFLDGKSEMRTPLGADRRLALQKLPGAVTVLQSKIGQAKRMLSNNSTTKTRSRRPLGAEEIALIEYRSQIAFDHEIRAVDYRYAEMGPDLDNARRLRDGFSGKLPDEMLNRLVGCRIERHQLAGNTEVELGTAEWRTLAQAICVASYEAMARQAERDDGEFNGQPIHPMLVKALLRVDSAKNDGVTFDEVINAEISRRGSGKHAKALPERTERKFRIACQEFSRFRSSDYANTVTAIEAKNWIASLQSENRLSNRTIGQKLQNVATVLNWGRHEDPENFHPLANPLNNIKRPDYVKPLRHLSAFTLEEAAQVLISARKDPRTFVRWIPWLCAYSGMRVSEASALKKEDFFLHEGRWFWRVSTVGGRTLKTGASERCIPVHKALEQEGLIRFIEHAPPGFLFRGEGRIPKSLQQRLSKWVRGLIPLEDRKELKPNHGWRHLFEDLCRRYSMPEEARNYITGRSESGSRSLYGHSEVMLPGLVAAMDKIKPFKLV